MHPSHPHPNEIVQRFAREVDQVLARLVTAREAPPPSKGRYSTSTLIPLRTA